MILLLVAALAAAFPTAETDPRFELLGAVQLLAGADKRYDGFFRHPIPYDAAVERRFKAFKRHPVVPAFDALAARGVKLQFLHDWLLTLSAPPELEPREPFLHGHLQQAGGAEALETFRLLLADFARASRFMTFHAEQEPARRAWVNQVEDQARRLKIRETLEAYTGLKVEVGYRVIVSPWTEPTLAGARVQEGAIISAFGPEELDGVVQYRLHTKRGQLWRYLAYEQLAPAQREHRPPSEAPFASIRGRCASTWPECARRQIAFAVGARLLELEGEAETAREWPVKYARMGLPHIGALVEALKEYEADRKRWPTLVSYYPTLLETLERTGAAKVPFGGGVADALGDPSTLVVTGTPWSDGWLRRNWARLHLPLTLERGRLSFHRRFAQQPLPPIEGKARLVTVAAHPDDPSRPVLIYTGTDEEEALSAKGAYAGPADYAVLVGSSTVKLGAYERSRIPWRLK